ncbi:hypothetical protein SDC9_171821 [bioreactor metagenome]|uniref:Uncharacterized protein n=1 Tax=bioreactor metagenome TaxID=1076179 RepID=A0A645GEI3_9ZZZZ
MISREFLMHWNSMQPLILKHGLCKRGIIALFPNLHLKNLKNIHQNILEKQG